LIASPTLFISVASSRMMSSSAMTPSRAPSSSTIGSRAERAQDVEDGVLRRGGDEIARDEVRRCQLRDRIVLPDCHRDLPVRDDALGHVVLDDDDAPDVCLVHLGDDRRHRCVRLDGDRVALEDVLDRDRSKLWSALAPPDPALHPSGHAALGLLWGPDLLLAHLL
jgi:hypothetical protein